MRATAYPAPETALPLRLPDIITACFRNPEAAVPGRHRCSEMPPRVSVARTSDSIGRSLTAAEKRPLTEAAADMEHWLTHLRTAPGEKPTGVGASIDSLTRRSMMPPVATSSDALRPTARFSEARTSEAGPSTPRTSATHEAARRIVDSADDLHRLTIYTAAAPDRAAEIIADAARPRSVMMHSGRYILHDASGVLGVLEQVPGDVGLKMRAYLKPSTSAEELDRIGGNIVKHGDSRYVGIVSDGAAKASASAKEIRRSGHEVEMPDAERGYVGRERLPHER